MKKTGFNEQMPIHVSILLHAPSSYPDLQIPRLNTEHAKRSYQYSTVKILNTIPTDIRKLPTISHFEKKLKEFLKS